MSLLKQLLLSVTVAIVCILAGTLIFSIDSARQYLDGQLQSESDNTASSLALTLSQPNNQDATVRELLMMALYDSGQFREIRFVDPNGRVLFERRQTGASVSSPAWFDRLLPLALPVATRDVSDGWRQLGRVTLTVDNAYAKDALWRSSIRVFLLVVAAGLAWALFAIFLVGWLKRALREEISEQVRTIGERGGKPRARHGSRVAELAPVANIISDVSERVRATVQEQDGQIESLKIELHRDPITGLANRKFFLNELRRELQTQADSGAAVGHVLIFRQRDLAAINAAMPRASVDEWLRSVGDRVTRVIEALPQPRPQLARLNGSDFVLLLNGLSGPEATRFAQAVRQVLIALRLPVKGAGLCRWAIALVDYSPSSDVSAIMAGLDHGLMSAESAGHGDIEYLPRDAELVRSGNGEADWRALLGDAIARNGLRLGVERVVYESDGADGEPSQRRLHEASLILDAGEQGDLPGNLFMPAAVRLGMSADCDLRAVELAFAWLDDHAGDLVIRISLPSLVHPGFLEEMRRRLTGLASHPDKLRRLYLELDAHGLVAHGSDVQMFCDMAVGAGCQVGLRRLAQQPAAIIRLHQAPLHYLKLGGNFSERLLDSPGGMQLMNAIVETARLLDIAIYADEPGDGETAAMLREHGIATRTAATMPSGQEANMSGLSQARQRPAPAAG